MSFLAASFVCLSLRPDFLHATVSAALIASSKLSKSSKDSKEKEDENGIPLAPSRKDVKDTM